MTRLAIFPLGTVLYPGLVLPLHIFEERYRELVRDLVALPEDVPRRFGVIGIRDGHEVGREGARALYEVGCTAEVHSVEPYEDGRFDIVTAGADRFRLGALDDSGSYLRAEVELLPEPPGEDAPPLASGVGRLFAAYRDALLRASGREPAEADELPDSPDVVSYLVAAAMILDLTDKQRLLEAPDTAQRLRAEQVLLRRETAILRELPSLPAVDLMRRVGGG